VERARNLEQKGETFGAWREYAQAAEEFDAFPASAQLKKAASSLESAKGVREVPNTSARKSRNSRS
jgi:hypothetical protein